VQSKAVKISPEETKNKRIKKSGLVINARIYPESPRINKIYIFLFGFMLDENWLISLQP
jgi:hypothetical protein